MQHKITIITGPSNSGKSFLARCMALGHKEAYFIDGRQYDRYSQFSYNVKSKNTMLILDDVNNEDVNAIVESFYNDNLICNPRGISPYMIDMPDIVITSINYKPSKDLDASFTRRITSFIECTLQIPYLNATPIFNFKKIELCSPTCKK